MICTDSGIESREEEKNPNIIQRFAQVMREGGNYPPIMCFPDGEYYRLIYGLNLLEAAREAGLDTILVDVHPNPSVHKLKTPEKDRMVKNFLSLISLMGEEEKENWSWRQIAKKCGNAFDESTVRNKAKDVGYTSPKKIKRATHWLPTSNLGQHNKGNRFDWTAIDDKQFEKIVYEIVKAHHPVEIETRSGTGGKGRDLQAKFISKGSLGEHIEEIYFVEAKLFRKNGKGLWNICRYKGIAF